MSYVPSISDEAALAKTGKNWSAWFRVLDRWGARKKSHPEIAKHLAAEHGLSGWWSQMVTVEFEKARGMRAAVGDRAARGFEVSVQRTVPLSAAETYALLATSRGLKQPH